MNRTAAQERLALVLDLAGPVVDLAIVRLATFCLIDDSAN